MNTDSAGTTPGSINGKHPGLDYATASPEAIMAEIERTRAHMDETLDNLGKQLHFGPKGKAAAWGVAATGIGILVWLAIRGYLGRKTRRRPHFKWHEARVLEQAVLAGRLARAVRKGRPAIIVVEPRKM